MRCTLELRSPANGTGTGERWAFSGRDGRLLRAALDGVGAFAVEAPVETYDDRRHRHVVPGDVDRWHAAMLLWPDEPSTRQRYDPDARQADAAWSADGALALADLLPERLGDLAQALRERFGAASRTG
jgi:hypothetical protein